MEQKTVDVVILGASGFTGKAVETGYLVSFACGYESGSKGVMFHSRHWDTPSMPHSVESDKRIQLKSSFASKGLNVKYLVVLSRARIISSHCTSFYNRIYNFTGKEDMDSFLLTLSTPEYRRNIVEMDPGSFRT
eukprot:Gb_01805 [translate_table: standard]